MKINTNIIVASGSVVSCSGVRFAFVAAGCALVLSAGLARGQVTDEVTGQVTGQVAGQATIQATDDGTAFAAERSVDQGRAYERELLTDAARRVSMASEGATAGMNSRGFFLSDGDAMTLQLGGSVQFRYAANIREEPPAGQEDFTQGFEFRRMRLWTQGTLWAKELTYKLEIETQKNGGELAFYEGYFAYAFSEATSLRVGQLRLPVLREELISSTAQLLTDRSLVNSIFTVATGQGITLTHRTENFRVIGAFSDGGKTQNTPFTSSAEADYALSGRADVRWGELDWKGYDKSTSWQGNKSGGLAGAAIHYQDGGETGGTTDSSTLLYTADVNFKGSGWNVFGMGVGRNTDPASGTSFDDFGAMVQGGVFVTEQVEPFARFQAIFPDSDRSGGSDDFYSVVVGGNYYVSPKSNAFTLTGEVEVTLSDQASSGSLVSPSNNYNILADSGDNQVIVRLQAQLLF